MKPSMTLVTLVAAAVLLGAPNADETTTHELEVEVVSADPEAGTLTIKPKPDADQVTVRVEGEALRLLEKLESGEMVLLTCRDEKDQHQAIVRIRRNKAI